MLFLLFGLALAGLFATHTRPGPDRTIAEAISAEASPSPQPLKTDRFIIADSLFRERRDAKKAREAYELYKALVKAHSEDGEAQWRLAMAAYYMTARVIRDEKEREKYAAEGRDAGEQSIHLLGDTCAACHFWMAINMAMYGDAVGNFKMFFSLSDIRKHLELSIAADPKYAFSGAYRLLGLVYQKIPGFFGGSDRKAREYFKKAIENSPDEPLNYLFLARVQQEGFDDKKAALETAEKGLQVPLPAAERVESVDAIADLKDFVTRLKTEAVAPKK